MLVESPLGTLLTDACGCVTALNPAMERMLAGLHHDPATEVLPRSVASVLPAVTLDDEGRPGVPCDWEALLTGRTARLTGELDLGELTGALIAVPLHVSDDALVHGSLDDLTGSAQADADLVRAAR